MAGSPTKSTESATTTKKPTLAAATLPTPKRSTGTPAPGARATTPGPVTPTGSRTSVTTPLMGARTSHPTSAKTSTAKPGVSLQRRSTFGYGDTALQQSRQPDEFTKTSAQTNGSADLTEYVVAFDHVAMYRLAQYYLVNAMKVGILIHMSCVCVIGRCLARLVSHQNGTHHLSLLVLAAVPRSSQPAYPRPRVRRLAKLPRKLLEHLVQRRL